MKLRLTVITVFLLFASIVATLGAEKTKVLLVTGGHGFDHEPFFSVFRENRQIDFTHAEHKKNADAFERDDLLNFDVLVLYDMPRNITDPQKAKFLAALDRGIGFVVLHHALVSYQHWPEYERIIGGRYPEEDGKNGVVTDKVGYEHDVEYRVDVLAKNHPVTAGVTDFEINDEIYWGFRVGSDVTPLITTKHPKSGKPLAWTRTERKSRIVYLQLGHGPKAFANPNYRKLLANSIQFVAR